MIALQSKLKWFGAQIAAVCPRAYHYCRPNNAAVPYAVWAEDGEVDSFHADGKKMEQEIAGSLNYFTKTEYDSVIDDLQTCLNENRVSWDLESVQYEPETGLIHYEWRWSLGEMRD